MSTKGDLEVVMVDQDDAEVNEIVARWGGRKEANLRAAIFCSFVDQQSLAINT